MLPSRHAIASLAAALLACGRESPRVGSRAAEPTCGGCHTEQTRRWEVSLHHASFTDPDFQTAYRMEPLPFCKGCHAPSSGPSPETRGVDCATCHPGAGSHASNAATRAGTRSCDGCHEFSHPGAASLLQTTVSEHRAGPFADVSCVDCHMPRGPGGRDHGRAVSRNDAWLAHALAVGPPRTADREVRVALETVGVGHRFPTGDLFRALAVRAWVEDPGGRVLGEASLRFARDAQTGADDRLDGARDVVIGLSEPPGPGATLRVIVDYERGAGQHGSVRALFGSTRIADVTRALR